MQLRDNDLAMEASGILAGTIAIAFGGFLNLYNAYRLFMESDGFDILKMSLIFVVFSLGILVLLVIVPYRFTQFVRVMGQAIREDNELGLLDTQPDESDDDKIRLKM